MQNLSSIYYPEASFDLSVAAQHQEPSSEEITALNKRLSWQLNHLERGLVYIPLNLPRTKLFVFVDGSFANKDMSSQIGYEIIRDTMDQRPRQPSRRHNQIVTKQGSRNVPRHK